MAEQSLEGLDIDWRLTEYDYSVELPIGDSQPSYVRHKILSCLTLGHKKKLDTISLVRIEVRD